MIYILAENDEKLNRVQNHPNFRKINLCSLEIGEFQLGELAENRFYLSNPEYFDVMGFASASWNKKYHHRIEALVDLKPQENQVYVADTVGINWAFRSDMNHPGMYKLLKELSSLTGKNLEAGVTFYSNNFVCHGNVFSEFLPFWKKCFFYLFDKYGLNPPFQNQWSGYKPHLHPAYLYERITMLYFANRQDLEICQL